MKKSTSFAILVLAAMSTLGCPRFHAECVGGEWSRTTYTAISANQSINEQSTAGCEYWLCRDGYLRQDGSCVQNCDADYTAQGRWCVKKCPSGQWAKGGECVTSCGKDWLYKEAERQCVEWCEAGYLLDGEKCVKDKTVGGGNGSRFNL